MNFYISDILLKIHNIFLYVDMEAIMLSEVRGKEIDIE